ncbi:MAG TPA: hypothetical protein VGQ86_11320 [Candidatus Limnocylindria bacterium]|nr:hypothetical protein [Candidatus Limnocylindria bacterium]
MSIDEKELALAAEHPRGTERRRLLPYRAALNDAAAYAALAESDRDVIVRWTEVRRRIRDASGVDHDPANLADPLVPYERLRAHVIEGERIAAARAKFGDPGGDLMAVVASLRRRG